MNRKAAVVAAFPLVVALACAAHEGPRLGTVDFAVGCNAAAQRDFNTAMAYYHSFAWGRSASRSSAH